MENNRVGIYGGSFDPIHNGHVNGMVTVAKRFDLDKVYAVPAFKNPLKKKIDGPTPEQRVEMVKLAIEGYEDTLLLDDQEIRREGDSYAVETVKSYADQVDPENLFLILGIDTFDRFDEWRDFEEILKVCNVVVTSRPGVRLPRNVNDLPEGVQPLVELYDPVYVELKTGRNIQFCSIEDIDISSTELRKRLKSGRGVQAYLPMKVESFLKENKLYEPIGDKIGDPVEFLKFVASVADSKRGIGMKAYDLKGLNAPSDYTLVISGTSARHAKSLGEYVDKAVKDEFGVLPVSFEGVTEGRWVLIDYGAIIVHVFYDFVRGEYNLEELWAEGNEITSDVVPAESK